MLARWSRRSATDCWAARWLCCTSYTSTNHSASRLQKQWRAARPSSLTRAAACREADDEGADARGVSEVRAQDPEGEPEADCEEERELLELLLVVAEEVYGGRRDVSGHEEAYGQEREAS